MPRNDSRSPFSVLAFLVLTTALAPIFQMPGPEAQAVESTGSTGSNRSADESIASLSTDSPAGWLLRFERAYESRQLDEYAALLTTDFRFHFGDDGNRMKYPNGWGREEELLSAAHLFQGFVNDRGVAMPAARSIEIELGTTTVEPDPGHPDDPRYAVIRAPAVSLIVDVGDGVPVGYFVVRDPHVFWLVRGDAADLSANQVADLDHWYLRRWVENAENVLVFAEP